MLMGIPLDMRPEEGLLYRKKNPIGWLHLMDTTYFVQIANLNRKEEKSQNSALNVEVK